MRIHLLAEKRIVVHAQEITIRTRNAIYAFFESRADLLSHVSESSISSISLFTFAFFPFFLGSAAILFSSSFAVVSSTIEIISSGDDHIITGDNFDYLITCTYHLSLNSWQFFSVR